MLDFSLVFEIFHIMISMQIDGVVANSQSQLATFLSELKGILDKVE